MFPLPKEYVIVAVNKRIQKTNKRKYEMFSNEMENELGEGKKQNSTVRGLNNRQIYSKKGKWKRKGKM